MNFIRFSLPNIKERMIYCSIIAHNHPMDDPTDPISHMPTQVRIVYLSTGWSPIPKRIRIRSVSMVRHSPVHLLS